MDERNGTNDKVKDVAATAAGGVSGTDLLYMGIDGMFKDGFDMSDMKLVTYGLIALVTGFFAWRKANAAKPATVNG